MKTRKRVAIATSAVAAIGLLGGCYGNGSFKGSAKMEGVDGGTAQVQFKLLCNVNTQKVSGALAFADSNVGVLLIGQPQGAYNDQEGLRTRAAHARPPAQPDGISSQNTCTGDPYGGDYYGTYLSLITKTTGEFEFGLAYEPECSAGFGAYMYIYSGPYEGYDNEGCLTSGRITPINPSQGQPV